MDLLKQNTLIHQLLEFIHSLKLSHSKIKGKKINYFFFPPHKEIMELLVEGCCEGQEYIRIQEVIMQIHKNN